MKLIPELFPFSALILNKEDILNKMKAIYLEVLASGYRDIEQEFSFVENSPSHDILVSITGILDDCSVEDVLKKENTELYPGLLTSAKQVYEEIVGLGFYQENLE